VRALEQMPIAGRERVCCYITRGRELLVFEHDQKYDDGAVGIQVVGGGVDEGETLEQAALRETFEESGLVLEQAVFLGTTRRVVMDYPSQPEWVGKVAVRHYFWLEAPPETPNSWSHTVSSGELDKGMVFHHRFVALENVDLVFEMGEMLERLKMIMECGSGVDLLFLGDDLIGLIELEFERDSICHGTMLTTNEFEKIRPTFKEVYKCINYNEAKGILLLRELFSRNIRLINTRVGKPNSDFFFTISRDSDLSVSEVSMVYTNLENIWDNINLMESGLHRDFLIYLAGAQRAPATDLEYWSSL